MGRHMLLKLVLGIQIAIIAGKVLPYASKPDTKDAQIKWALDQVSTAEPCGGVKQSTAGVIEYKYDQDLDRDERCIWTIQTTHNFIGFHLIDSGFNQRAQLSVYSVDRDGIPRLIGALTESSDEIHKFPGPLIFLVLSSGDGLAVSPTSMTETTIDVTTVEPSTPYPCDPWYDPCCNSEYNTWPPEYCTTVELPTTSTTTTKAPTTEPPPPGTGFLLSFRGEDGNAAPGRTYKHLFLESTTAPQTLKYPEIAPEYPGNEILSIIINPLSNTHRISITAFDVKLPSPNGENNCELDTLKVWGPAVSSLETRLQFCTEDMRSYAKITSSKQFLLILNSVDQQLSGRGGFSIHWKSI